MKYFVTLIVCLLMAGGCARSTYMPTHNLDGRSDQVSRTLVLTQVAPEERLARVDGFLDAMAGSIGVVTLVTGKSIPNAEKASIESVLIARGIRAENIVRKTADGSELSLVFSPTTSVNPELDTFWFSSAAVAPDFGRATNYNLAVSAVHPEHLDKPAQLGAPSAQGAVGPVERYQGGQVRELQEVNVSVGGGSSSSSSN